MRSRRFRVPPGDSVLESDPGTVRLDLCRRYAVDQAETGVGDQEEDGEEDRRPFPSGASLHIRLTFGPNPGNIYAMEHTIDEDPRSDFYTYSNSQPPFTEFKHWKVVQEAPGAGGTVNWFGSSREARAFAKTIPFVVSVEGVTCDTYDELWPEDYRGHNH